jgi:hypothetical protein
MLGQVCLTEVRLNWEIDRVSIVGRMKMFKYVDTPTEWRAVSVVSSLLAFLTAIGLLLLGGVMLLILVPIAVPVDAKQVMSEQEQGNFFHLDVHTQNGDGSRHGP